MNRPESLSQLSKAMVMMTGTPITRDHMNGKMVRGSFANGYHKKVTMGTNDFYIRMFISYPSGQIDSVSICHPSILHKNGVVQNILAHKNMMAREGVTCNGETILAGPIDPSTGYVRIISECCIVMNRTVKTLMEITNGKIR